MNPIDQLETWLLEHRYVELSSSQRRQIEHLVQTEEQYEALREVAFLIRSKQRSSKLDGSTNGSTLSHVLKRIQSTRKADAA